jgi:hypothetical protein
VVGDLRRNHVPRLRAQPRDGANETLLALFLLGTNFLLFVDSERIKRYILVCHNEFDVR